MNIIITGSNGLIGSTIVKYLSEQNIHKVYGVDKDEISLYVNDNYKYIKTDVSDLESVIKLRKIIDDKDVFIEGLINCHQYKPKGFLNANIFEMDLDMWNNILSVNLSGTYFMCREFAKKMKEKKKGSIINFASTYAVVSSNPKLYEDNNMGNPIAYSASKGGVISLTRYLAAYLGEYGIRSNSITPHGVLNNHQESFKKRFSQMSPMNRMMNPKEILGPIELLLTNSGSYINGTNLMVDGGWTAW